MAFKKYDKRTNTKIPTITLTKCKSLGINSACIEKFFKDAKALELFYDDEDNRIGLKPSKKEAPHMYTLRRKDGTSASVSCSGLIKHFGIKVYDTQRFIPAWNEKEDLLEIHLGKPLTSENIEKAEKAERLAAAKASGISI